MARTRPDPTSPTSDLRETLFGDMPLAAWGSGQSDAPWSQFAMAARCLAAKDRNGAVAALQAIVAQPELGSRHHLQAWDALRLMAVSPPADAAKHVLGVVVDVPVETGIDTLAAYADGTARYLNYSGSVVVWDAPDERLGRLVRAVVAEGQKIAAKIGPWQGPRPALPTGQMRLSMLTPSGLHFGQAPFDVLAREPLAAPLVDAAVQLMQALIEVAGAARS